MHFVGDNIKTNYARQYAIISNLCDFFLQKLSEVKNIFCKNRSNIIKTFFFSEEIIFKWLVNYVKIIERFSVKTF